MTTIRLLPLGDGALSALAARLSAPLADRFAADVLVEPARPLRPEWRDADRGQYDAQTILDALVASAPGAGEWQLALTDVDLFVPGMRFVFGLATIGGCCAVVSRARLRPEFHGEPADAELLFRRELTEATHELGHIAGLRHCANPHCVMHFSNTLAETDEKGPDFCGACRREAES